MLESLLLRVTKASRRHAWLVIIGSVVACLSLGALVTTVPINLTLLSIIDKDDPEVAHFFEVSDSLRTLHRMLLLVEGPEQQLDPALEELGPALEELPEVAEVRAERPLDWLEARAPYLVERRVFDDWVRVALSPGDEQSTERLRAGLARVAAVGVRHPVAVTIVALGLVVAALAGLPRFELETDLEKVFSRDLPALETGDRIKEIYGVDTQPWIVITDTLDEARAVTGALEATPTFGTAHSAATLLPDDLTERQRILRQSLPAMIQAQTGITGALVQAALKGAPTPADLLESLKRSLMTPDGRFIVRAYAADPSLDGRDARDRRLVAQAIAPEATGMGVVLEQTAGGDRPWLKWVFVAILGFVLAVLALDLRSVRWMIVAVSPVVFGTICCVGVFCWVGIPFNVDTVLVMPLLIGLGVDDGIHEAHRIRQMGGPPDKAAVSVGRAITMTTLTTIASVTAFLFSDHRGLESLALVLIIGLPLCLAATLLLVPALTLLTRPPR